MEPIRESARQTASGSPSGAGRPNPFPSTSQGLAYTIHHPNACPNNTEDLFGFFEALESAENTAERG